MKTHVIPRIISLVLLAGVFTGGCRDTGSAEGDKTVIAVIPKGTTQEFWQLVHAGAIKLQLEITSGTPS